MDRELFALVPAKQVSGAAFGLSVCLHAILVVLLSWIPPSPAVKRAALKNPEILAMVAPAELYPAANDWTAGTDSESSAELMESGSVPAQPSPKQLPRAASPAPHRTQHRFGAAEGGAGLSHEAPSADAITLPVEILSKPSPAYTGEARRLRIEGDVVLEVLFMASGELRVLDIVAGLGHGLDEAAVRTAERIRFKPARRNGTSVDCPAIIRISFSLPDLD